MILKRQRKIWLARKIILVKGLERILIINFVMIALDMMICIWLRLRFITFSNFSVYRKSISTVKMLKCALAKSNALFRQIETVFIVVLYDCLMIAFFVFSGTLRAVGLYPLNALVKARDVSFSRNPTGRLYNVKPAPGPDGRQGTSYQFYGRRNSFITLPNRGKLDTRRSITILAYIFHSGHSGPIVHYYARGWGVHFWMINQRTIFVRFMKRRSRGATHSLASRSIRPNTWQFVGTSYDHRTGVAKLFLNGRVIAKRRIGRIRLATNYPIRVGAKIGDGRYFRGRISCIQIYNVALTARQIAARARRCFMKRKCITILRPFAKMVAPNSNELKLN